MSVFDEPFWTFPDRLTPATWESMVMTSPSSARWSIGQRRR